MLVEGILFDKLKQFCEINEQFKITFERTEKNKDLSRSEKNNICLYYIAQNLIYTPQYFTGILTHFAEELPLLLSISLFSGEKHKLSHDEHVSNCVLLGRVIKLRGDMSVYALKYFEKCPSPFETKIEVKGAKIRRMQYCQITDLDVVEASYVLLKSNADFYRNKWNWSEFLNKNYFHIEEKVKWYVCHVLAILCGMDSKSLSTMLNNLIKNDVANDLVCTLNTYPTLSNAEQSVVPINQHPCIHKVQDFSREVTNISGIYIPTLASENYSDINLVEVFSTGNNLRKVALGLSANKAVCLQGPVGSGKTSVVEYLAKKSGRKLGQNFVKVQLGDQTDSKMLLGTYRCTDVPGEFVWQPGVLTQAVVEGNWLLLEDIDSASMDIASLLTSLLENNVLSVPGYRDSVPVSPGFQLFVTQRLLSTITGHHKKHSNAMTLLEKHLLQVNIDSLTTDELKEILNIQYPSFSTIADRMLKVFNLFSKTMDTQINIPKTSRLISTRDFFKWCSRAIIDFEVSSQASALKVLQDAIDVFCCSYHSSADALDLAREISTHLGIINHKADYFFKTYKPNMKLTPENLIAGRASLKRENNHYSRQIKFSFTRPTAVLLERIMCCINLNEPVLLVGETGTGKTSSVQYLASTTGQKLIVINMNQQSDSADLLGGFKPVDLKFIITPIRRQFETVFCDYFKVEPNKKYLSNIAYCFNSQRWSDLLKLMNRSYEAALNRLNKTLTGSDENDEKLLKDKQFLIRWQAVGEKLQKLDVQLKQKSALAFSFIEGSLVKAVENGYWVLLDEINLANAETLECLSGLLEGSEGSLCLLERGDKQPVKRHPNFTLFACMNPSTDVGKKDLPSGLRNRFTEFFVDELTDRNDLLLLVNNYLEAMSLKDRDLNKIVDFYLKVRRETITVLSDGLGHKPHYSLRSLCRALMIAAINPCGIFKRSLFEAFCLSFLTQLDSDSYRIVEKMIGNYLIGDEKAVNAVLKQPIPEPQAGIKSQFLQFEGYWVHKGALEPFVPEEYVLTDSVRRNLKDLVRVVSIGRLPVLLQGDTSVGKTSLISYLAKASGNKCVRINNHEHTDLQEYIGSYVADINGKLVFREGLLVEAMRKGHWIILDELNLAPTDVLEALNRVLDDNRELFIPETQEVVKADPNFMLFATQNPPGAYGGRKMLSRAFRNRFVELHFNEIPPKELEFILHKRCQMAPSYAKKMINVMTELQVRRRGSAAFAGKQGFITLRDLFRWGERYRLAENINKLYDWDQHLADEGYLVLAGRVRKSEEKQEIIAVLEKHWKRKVIPESLFTLSDHTSSVTKHILMKIQENSKRCENIVWTFNMRKLAVLVWKALQFKEPVLLVGETGGGKTTVCKLIAENNGQELLTVNCHMHTESSDFIGGLRPVRDHSNDDANKLFEWVDGPLIHAMIKCHVFLADEISLADDSVLERLNSLLEPERTLLLAEKGTDINNTDNSEFVVADPNFYFIGTMNPGGDFGKKELSPALRNRFTEIWCETCTDRKDLVAIIERNVKPGISLGNQQDGSSGVGNSIMDFVEWLKKTEIGKRLTTSIRDILTWVSFLNTCADKVDAGEAYVHGACLTFLDSLGSGVTSTESLKTLDEFKNECYEFLAHQLNLPARTFRELISSKAIVEASDTEFGIKPFYIEIGVDLEKSSGFSFNAPTTVFNTLRLLRGMQLHKAILLEGSPGVGKTSLVTALARISRHQIFRINLSDQTDISDLFGADLPVEGGTGGQFSWRDGPLLQALKQGHWILLDELNLASQSVLEGLNACLDHRGEIFIPELDKTFHVKAGTRFFACQNPLKQGGSRRGLPQSFLNRFIQVYINFLTDKDLEFILLNQFKDIPSETISKMILFNTRIVRELDDHSFGHKGAPWECNLRDLTRWCQVMLYQYENYVNEESEEKRWRPESSVFLIYGDRMRTLKDKETVKELFVEVFGRKISGSAPVAYFAKDKFFIGDVRVDRGDSDINTHVLKQGSNCLVLRKQLPILRSLAYCVNLNWMSILVGSTGSGKSSVVRTLASLTGKTLRTLPVTSAMDTTDILGGFEQTDYTRHLDEIAKETERLLLRTLQDLLINAELHESVALLETWESYRALEVNTPKQTMDEESKLFMRKLSKLESIWEKLNKSSNFTRISELDKLRNKSRYMSDCVKNEGSLNAGGKFEWVDSVLIKCLQDGSWLLIDNVNLCSAAVLDRLNALLEPNGVLTISERAVDANGHMIEVKPHKDFRLFLTMDPKNGEISRAMRNRGVEIYMLNEKEANYINQYDIKSLIESHGLKSTRHINCLIQIHDFISELILGDKPNVNELLQAASLISQQLNYGTKELEAFYRTVVEIYCKTRSAVEFSCNNISGIIKNEIENIMDESLRLNTKGPFEMYDKSVTLSTQNIQFSVDLEKVKQHSAMLENILRLDTVQKHENILINLFQNCYSITSLEDLPIRHLYLGKTLQRLNEPDFCKLNDDLHLIILNQLGKFTDDLPIDLRWTPDILLSMKNITESNILNFTLFTVCKYFQENIETERNNKNARSLKEVTLLTYMHEVKSKKFEDKFNNPVVASFLELIEEYDSSLKTAILGVKELTDHDVINLYYLFMWRLVFFRCTLQGINKKTSAERHKILTNLTVHYKWFLKNSVMRVFKIFNLQISDKLEETIATIDNKLEKEFSFMHKVGKNFQKFNDKPPPCINEDQLESIALYKDIAIFYNICDKRNNVVRISNNLMENPELHNLLIQLQSKLDFEFTDISKEIISLQSLHKSNMENFVQDNDASNFKAQISPLFATFILRKLHSFISVKFKGINFLGNNALIPIELQGLLLRFSKSRNPRTLHELSTSYFTYVMNSACVRPGRYLRDSEGEVEDIVLHGSNPLMSYHLTSLLVSTSNRDNLPMTTLGNFKRMERRHLWCNILLWCDVKQFSDDEHDYLNCQKLYVVNDFKTFIRQFSKSLRIPSGEAMTDTDLTDTCIKKLLNLKEVSSLRETKENVLQFTTLLQTCAENIARLSESTSFDEKLLFTSDIYMRLSYIKFLCNSKLPLIDPLAKQSLKRSYCTEAIEMFSDMKTAYVLQNDVFSGNEETLHAYVPHITKMVEDLKKEDEALGKYIAVRPRDVMYEAVVKVVHHGYNTVLSFDNVNKTLNNLNDQINILIQATEAKAVVDLTECIVILNQYDCTVATYENLIQEWSAYRSGYPDIIEPLLSNITQFLYGIVMKLSLLRKLVKECEISKFDIKLKNEMLNLVKIPSLDANQTSYGEMINFFTSQKMQNFINNLLHNDEFPNIKKVENFRLLKCGIQESFNHCITDSKNAECVNKQLIQKFLSLVQRFVNAWNKQEELKEVQQREAESLYKTKTKCDDLPEEKQIEKELKELFPNYHDIDFADFQKTSEMGDDDINISTSEGNLSGIITEEDLEFVVDLHTTLLKNYTTAEWLSPKRNKALSPNFVQPLMEKFKLFRQILEKTIDGLDYTMDARLAGSFIVLSSVHQRYGDVSELCDASISKNKSFDFYKDTNVEEVKSALPILEELRSRISELLVEWPDQPTLKMILTVIDRLYSFDITSPISRFCTGFEILLNKLHEWEEVAHSGVSLSQYSQNVIQQIITWRKLELNMWKNLDNITYERLNKARQKWWVYIFEITQQFVAEKRFSADELIESLQHFVTKSNLAEFEARMELLFTFHCHAVFLERTQESELYINILWNVYSYFKQFSTTIRNKIKDLQAPIDKKMKDYIKIVKWKDTSYWSAKEMVDKTHKTLHKYVRELENVLRQPVAPFLKDASNISTVDNVGIWDRPKRQSPKKYHYTLDADSYILKSVGKKLFSTSFTFDEGLLSRTDSYLQKSRKLCKETILATKYPSLMRSLDSFVREIIASSSSLSKMEVDTTLPKNKQISQAKGILQRKHRALADLFKALSKIGLSFRMGIIDSKLIAPSSDFVLKPIDLNANFSHLSHGPKDEKILTIWDSCEMYYVRSLNRRDVLNTALEVPAKDLGIQNIERCKGFSAHLLALTQQLKSELIESTRIFYYLRIYFKKITEFCGNKQFLPANRLERIRELLINVSIVLEQYKIVFNTIPEGKSKSHDLTTIDIPSWVTGEGCEMNPFKDDLFVMKLIKYVNDTLNISSKLVSYLEQCRGVLPCVEFTIKYFEYVPIDDIEVIMEDLNSIHKNINEIHKMIGNIPLGESLQWLSKEFCTVKEDLQYCESEYTTDDTGNFKAQVEKFIEKNLLVIQSMYKRYITATPEEAVTTDPTDEEKETQLEDNHLKTLVIENLTQDFSALEMRNILRLLHKIVDVLFSGPPSSGHRDIVLQAMPLFEQTILLYQYFITQQVSAYRLTCKMNSILLSIFTELVSKGFCIPPEFSDEMDSEGISKPSDGLGLGDGEGQKDVSDKIESEDQLEEAHPAGQEKEAEEDKECKEEDKGIEMSEDFDSKLQDKEKRDDDDDDDDSNSDSDAHEQMGETGKGADELDQEIWGSDKEDNENEDDPESKEEKGNTGEKQSEEQLGAKDEDPAKTSEHDDRNASDEKEQKTKEINEMEEPELDDEQTDPYHGKQAELPEPEAMDLPDDLQLDEGQENDNETQEENPFDIDTMKEQNIPQDVEEDGGEKAQEEPQNDEAKDYSSDEEEITKKPNDLDEEMLKDSSENEATEDQNKTQNEAEKDDDDQKDTNETDESAFDQTQSKEDNVEAMEVNESAIADKTEASSADIQRSSEPMDELSQEDQPDKEGVGQSQMEESSSGHNTQMNAPQEIQIGKRDREDENKSQRPGESDSTRSLGDTSEPVKKKLKTVDAKNTDDIQRNDREQDDNAEMYQHIKDASEDAMTQVLDAATKEQAEAQEKDVPNVDEEEVDKPTETSEELPPEDENEDIQVQDGASQQAEIAEKKTEMNKKRQHPEGDILEEVPEIDVEGDIIKTSTVQRSTESTHHTAFSNLSESSATRLTVDEINALRVDVEKQLSVWNEPPTELEAEQTWQKISSVTSSLAQDLSEQLRLVLEPTQASRLKGDFRTGRRINMRKVIPYIASQFRKDKIWLRRTKPSKREYQIVLAIDDSSSMADNKSKELAFESVALISKALTLLESGQLAVLSFGESTEILHKLTDTFTDKSGVKLLQKFKFDQNKTGIAKLVDFTTEMFNQSQAQSIALNAKLLVIVSDGRGVFSEGESYVREAVRRAKLSNIFMVFVIIDNPENKNSILDIRMPVFKDGKLFGIESYMDAFPFSFYIILRDINSLPSVLSDALRQWFEIVSNLDKQ